MTLLRNPKDQSNDDYKKVFDALLYLVEKYGGTIDKPGLVLCQLVTNGVVAGANGDVFGAANPAQIVAAKETISDSTKAAIFLYGVNVRN